MNHFIHMLYPFDVPEWNAALRRMIEPLSQDTVKGIDD
jgi:hypothetical protein